MRFFFPSEVPESSCDCPQTDTSEEREQIAHCNYYALNSQTAHLHAAIVFVYIRMAGSGGAIIPRALHYCKTLKQQ